MQKIRLSCKLQFIWLVSSASELLVLSDFVFVWRFVSENVRDLASFETAAVGRPIPDAMQGPSRFPMVHFPPTQLIDSHCEAQSEATSGGLPYKGPA